MAGVLPRCLALCIVSLCVALPPGHAQPALKPYKAVEVTIPTPPADKSLDAFRKQLAAIAQRKDRAALAKLVAAKDFFWESDFGGMFDAKKSGLDNLANALRLGEASGRGWAALAAFAAEPTIGRAALNPHSHCAPAPPQYEDAELAALGEETNTDVVDWSYPRQAGLQVRADAAKDAGVVETLGHILVRVLGAEGAGRAWLKVATPGGRIGYVPGAALVSTVANRLCFAKDGAAWRITGYVGGGD